MTRLPLFSRSVVAVEVDCSLPLARRCPLFTLARVQSSYPLMIVSLCACGRASHLFSSKQHISMYCMAFLLSMVVERAAARSTQLLIFISTCPPDELLSPT